MKLPFDQSVIRLPRHWWLGLACLGALAALCAAWRVQQHIAAQFESARVRANQPHFVPFERQRRDSLGSNEIAVIQSAKHVNAIARFKESYFAATGGGLLELSPTGAVVKHYSVLDGLPESELLALAVFNGRLYLGTSTQGLVEFDGERFTRLRWTDRAAQAVTALLADSGRLLIGTFAGGLLAFDGQQFSEIEAEQQRLRAITGLVQAGPRLLVGTFDNGLWLEAAGRWRHFTTAAGLPSSRITGIVADHERVFVATDFGLAVAHTEELLASGAHEATPQFQTLALLPSLSGLARYQDRLFACKDDGSLFQLSLLDGKTKRQAISRMDWNSPPTLTGCRLATLDQALWLLGSEGLWRSTDAASAASARLVLTPFNRADDARSLANNLVSALAFDGAGRLWVGTFRNGIEVFNPAGQRLARLEAETLREINYLCWDAAAQQMLAATTSGLFIFDSALQPRRVTSAEGLLSNAVAHVALLPAKANAATKQPNALLLATSRGLSFGEPGKWRALTTAQGLPSNSLYAALPVGERIYAGTLAGLAEIEAGRVVRVFKDSNSKLTHNWVTSLCAVGPRLFIGAYGGGIFELTAAGELSSFASEIGRVVVNPNALFSDGARLYAGTLDGAWVLELRSQRWLHLRSELPASTVLSITGDGRHVYFGATHGIARVAVSYLQSLAHE